jgi:hypothetical protein
MICLNLSSIAELIRIILLRSLRSRRRTAEGRRCQWTVSGIRAHIPALAAQERSAEWSSGQSSIHHQLDRIDVRRIVRSQEKHSLCEFFRLAPAA